MEYCMIARFKLNRKSNAVNPACLSPMENCQSRKLLPKRKFGRKFFKTLDTSYTNPGTPFVRRVTIPISALKRRC